MIDKAVFSFFSFDFFFFFYQTCANLRRCFLFFFLSPLSLSLSARLWDTMLSTTSLLLTHFTHSYPLPSSSCPAEATPEPSHECSRPQPTSHRQE